MQITDKVIIALNEFLMYKGVGNGIKCYLDEFVFTEKLPDNILVDFLTEIEKYGYAWSGQNGQMKIYDPS